MTAKKNYGTMRVFGHRYGIMRAKKSYGIMRANNSYGIMRAFGHRYRDMRASGHRYGIMRGFQVALNHRSQLSCSHPGDWRFASPRLRLGIVASLLSVSIGSHHIVWLVYIVR